MGEGFSKLSNLAEAAAQRAAAVTADAEAKLVASLNADVQAAAASARTGERPGGPVRQEGEAVRQEGEGIDFTSMPRRELEELCAKRSEKLKQAVQKIRAQQLEYARVQRDYEQLQQIVRADVPVSSEIGEDQESAQAMLDLKDARDHCAILKQQLATRDATIAQLQAQLQSAGSVSASDGGGASRADAGAEARHAELKALQAKLQQAQEAASSAAASSEEALRRARAEHAAALEDAEKRAADRLAVGEAHGEAERLRAEVSKLEQENVELKADLAKEKEKIEKIKVKSQEIVGKFKTQAAEKKELEDRIQVLLSAQDAAAGASPAPNATQLSNLQAANAAVEEEKRALEVKCRELEEAARKLESGRMRADEASVRLEEALAGYQDQVAELQSRVHELESEKKTFHGSQASSAAAAALQMQALTERVRYILCMCELYI